MKEGHGFLWFGLFEGAPYGDCTEKVEDYEKLINQISKAKVLKHIDSLSPSLTSAPTYDVFTGERFGAGLYNDGKFLFTTDFVRYYRDRDIGIPIEYEEYLINNKIV